MGALLWVSPTHAQAPAGNCDGEIVTAIDIQPERPPFAGHAGTWRSVARAFGLHHATTKADVVAAFLSVKVGQPCSPRALVESERVLRAQSFIADARVTAVHDSLGRLVIQVETTDEIPALMTVRFHGFAFPRALSIGDGNVGGLGLLLDAGFERATGYRLGLKGRIISSAAFGHPYRFVVDGERAPLGYRFLGAFEHPFFTDIQRIGWHAAYQSLDEYRDVERPADDGLALNVRQERWEGSSVARVFGTRTITVLGLAASRVHVVPADSGILVTDQGLAPDTGTVLRGRYSPFTATRVGVIAGIRRVEFKSVTGFDALFGTQDVATGLTVGAFGAKGLSAYGEADNFLSGAGYIGAATQRTMIAGAAELEARRAGTGRWDSAIASGRAAFYMKAGDPFTLTISDEASGGTRSLLPLQLSFSDLNGGLRGYHGSSLAGARRNVVRTEFRWAREAAVAHADVGVAAFSDAGTLWAGDAPYGVTTTRQSVGLSVLAAYPTRSKRIYRLDAGLALGSVGRQGGPLELRLTSTDRTQRFWLEPDDVSRARTGAVPSSLFAWP